MTPALTASLIYFGIVSVALLVLFGARHLSRDRAPQNSVEGPSNVVRLVEGMPGYDWLLDRNGGWS